MVEYRILEKDAGPSRGEADYADKLLSAMRFEFGGHLEKDEPMGGNAS
jgi:6-phosphogluconate dehydrogenase (decarboxylating)